MNKIIIIISQIGKRPLNEIINIREQYAGPVIAVGKVIREATFEEFKKQFNEMYPEMDRLTSASPKERYYLVEVLPD